MSDAEYLPETAFCPHCNKPAPIKQTANGPTYGPHAGKAGWCTYGAGTGIPISRRAEITA